MTSTPAVRTGAIRTFAVRIRASRAWASRGAAILLGAGCVVWATAPLVRSGYAGFALFLAILGVAAGALRLVLAGVPVPEDNYLLPGPLRVWLGLLQALRVVPWEEGALIAILWLELLHPARPWHTAVLGVALIGYLLATHLAESGASPQALRPQVRVLAVGAGLLALGAGTIRLGAAAAGGGGRADRRRRTGLALRRRARPAAGRREIAGAPAGPGPVTPGTPWRVGGRCRDIQGSEVIPDSSLRPGG
jgi:hypothetical protein